VVVGTDEQIQKFGEAIDKVNADNPDEIIEHHIELCPFIVEENSPFIGKSIKTLRIREKADCMVIGIDRDGESSTNISPNTIFKKDDVIWIAGEREKLSNFQKYMT